MFCKGPAVMSQSRAAIRSDAATGPFAFDNSYARLPERLFARLDPTPVAAPELVRLNRPLAELLGADVERLAGSDGAAIFSGNAVPDRAQPLAMAYAGHQFGQWVPQLGDGRAILLGEVVGRDGVRRDIQLKGSGRTPFSRMGDGRAALGPVMREYILSEAMTALGVPSSRSLAFALTGERVLRQDGPEQGAVLTRVARSHVRVGTFQFFLARDDREALAALSDYVIARHDPDLAEADNPPLELLKAVIARTADLVAQWQLIGFIHGVMNTDNMQLAGETIDYGPCAFIDRYHPDTVYSSIDQFGRYAYRNQPPIAAWNMARFAETLLPIMAETPQEAVPLAEDALEGFAPHFQQRLTAGWRAKLGLTEAQDDDLALAVDLLGHMAEQGADFTLTFRALCDLTRAPGPADEALSAMFAEPAAVQAWTARWRQRLAGETASDTARRAAMRAANPAYIPRNHQVEQAIQAARQTGDFSVMDRLMHVLAQPFDDHPGYEDLARPPRPEQEVHQTFCGT